MTVAVLDLRDKIMTVIIKLWRSVQFNDNKAHSHTEQSSPPFTSRTLSILQNWKPLPIKHQLPSPRSPQPLASTILLLVTLNLTTLGTSFK